MELNLYALGGLMNITGEPDRPPLKEGAPMAQLGAGPWERLRGNHGGAAAR